MTSSLEVAVVWRQTGDAVQPYAARVDGRAWLVRIGDFPAEPLYTLIVDGAEIASFDTWPTAWTRPDTDSEQR